MASLAPFAFKTSTWFFAPGCFTMLGAVSGVDGTLRRCSIEDAAITSIMPVFALKFNSFGQFASKIHDVFLGHRYTFYMREDTVFDKILRGELPATVVYEDDDVLGFLDIHPKAPTHVLFIPKVFCASVATATGDHAHLPGLLVQKAREFAVQKGIDGYKLSFNVGEGGGQEVPYLHLHFLAQASITAA